MLGGGVWAVRNAWHDWYAKNDPNEAWEWWVIGQPNQWDGWDWDPWDPDGFDVFWTRWRENDETTWTWLHIDPTLLLWDNPSFYRVHFSYDWFKMGSCYDDHLFHPSPGTRAYNYDGDDSNGLLWPKEYPRGDIRTLVDYAGPNLY